MDIYEYEPSYDGYSFLQPTDIASNSVDTMTKPLKIYLKASQGQKSPPSPIDTAMRCAKSFNKSNQSIIFGISS